MEKKYFVYVFIFVLAVGLLYACDSGNGGGSSDGDVSGDAGLPPDPGEEGKLTLEGIDSDSDGVRDDVQIAIYERYPDDEGKRAALEQSTKALQEALLAGDSSSDTGAFEAAKLVANSVDCLFLSINDSDTEVGFLEGVLVNTPERSEAYGKFNELASGQFYGDGDSEDSCQ